MASKSTYVCFTCRDNSYPGVQVYLDGRDEAGKTKYLNSDMTRHIHREKVQQQQAQQLQQQPPPQPQPQQMMKIISSSFMDEDWSGLTKPQIKARILAEAALAKAREEDGSSSNSNSSSQHIANNIDAKLVALDSKMERLLNMLFATTTANTTATTSTNAVAPQQQQQQQQQEEEVKQQ
jgi:hypothetical protein